MKKKVSKSVPVLFALALILLASSAVGSARAALTYFNEEYAAQMNASTIGVTLLENGEAVSYRNYTADNTWQEESGTLLAALDGADEKILPGKEYPEVLAVKNSGSIDIYARVILRRYWMDEDGNKDTTLSPELIELDLPEGSGWVIDGTASTKERLVLYYTKPLSAAEGENVTAPLNNTVRIGTDIVKKISVSAPVDGKVETVYDYNGYRFCLEAEVDAVQTHNAADAIKSAWGVDVTVDSEGNLTPPAAAGSGN